MPRYAIKIEYDGTGFSGFQAQNNVQTIQGALEEALFNFSGEHSEVYASGRTDAGVHALGMVAHLDLEKSVNPENLKNGLNFYLKEKRIVVLDAVPVADDFHARFSAIQRTYIYRILSRPVRPAIRFGFVHWTHHKLNIKAMEKGAEYLIGKHDFTSFRAVDCQAKSPVKTMDSIKITESEDEVIIEFSARSFLYHQVRNIVGALLEVGIGKLQPEDIKRILELCDRTKAPAMAPATGLYFKSVKFDSDIWNKD